MEDLLRSKDMISGKRKIYGFIAAALLILLTVQPSLAEELEASDQASRPSLGGPDAVVNLMESDRADKDALYEFRLLKPYFDWKDGIKEKYGLAFGSDYTGVYLTANDNLPGTDDYASGGMVRFFGVGSCLGAARTPPGR